MVRLKFNLGILIFVYLIPDALSKSDMVKNKQEENYRDSILQKSIEFPRRNSYSDLSKFSFLGDEIVVSQ